MLWVFIRFGLLTLNNMASLYGYVFKLMHFFSGKALRSGDLLLLLSPSSLGHWAEQHQEHYPDAEGGQEACRGHHLLWWHIQDIFLWFRHVPFPPYSKGTFKRLGRSLEVFFNKKRKTRGGRMRSERQIEKTQGERGSGELWLHQVTLIFCYMKKKGEELLKKDNWLRRHEKTIPDIFCLEFSAPFMDCNGHNCLTTWTDGRSAL